MRHGSSSCLLAEHTALWVLGYRAVVGSTTVGFLLPPGDQALPGMLAVLCCAVCVQSVASCAVAFVLPDAFLQNPGNVQGYEIGKTSKNTQNSFYEIRAH